MPDAVLCLNAGSSSIKFGLFRAAGQAELALLAHGVLEDTGEAPRFVAKDPSGKTLEDRHWEAGADHAKLLGGLIDWIEHHLDEERLRGIGHRIVHGGRDFVNPVRLDAPTIAAIDRLTPLAPLHQPRSLEPIRALAALRPDLPQVGCFDTAFHHTMTPPASRFALPRSFEEDGIRRYGFHGLSYEFIAGKLAEVAPALAHRRIVVAHLGNGASLCALREGRSVDTTMGFSALDGLVMGTRPGRLDPGIVLHLQRAYGLDVAAVEQLLYHTCGLLGVSGLSSDMRVLSDSREPHAAEAIDLFAFTVARETAALAASLGGLDGLVFTGGIGEHAPDIRDTICARLAWLGLDLDRDANRDTKDVISRPGSRIEIRVIPTDEERVIAGHVIDVIGGRS